MGGGPVREWRPPKDRHFGCHWERDTEPHEHTEECVADYCDWSPTEFCHHYVAERIILDDGRWFDVCDAHGHGLRGEVLPLVTVRWQPTFNQAMKYFYQNAADAIERGDHLK